MMRRLYGEAGHDLTLENPALPGVVLHYTALHQILADVADARVYGGIHFRFDQDAGDRLGREVATFVEKKLPAAYPPVGPRGWQGSRGVSATTRGSRCRPGRAASLPQRARGAHDVASFCGGGYACPESSGNSVRPSFLPTARMRSSRLRSSSPATAERATSTDAR